MSPTAWKLQPRHAVTAVLWVAGAALGWRLGWDFGDSLGGGWFSVVAAANGAAFCTLLADAMASRLFGRRQPPRR